MTPISRTTRVLSLAIFTGLAAARADVALPPLFSNGMVLQSGMPTPVWGTAGPDEGITVEVAGQSHETRAGKDGRWHVTLKPLAPRLSTTLTVRAANTLTVPDVLTGEVWFAAGQSNMELYINSLPDDEKPSAGQEQIRLFKVEKEGTPEPIEQVKGRWVKAAPQPPGLFSAVGYLFASGLHAETGTPVGIIQATWGGTRIDTWSSAACLDAFAQRPELAKRREIIEKLDASAHSVAEHRELTAQWKANPELPKPVSPCELPSRLFNGMVRPVMPYAVRGVLWYQGESDAYLPDYGILFPAMITDWRQHWGQQRLPFLFVQLPNYREPVEQPPLRSFWAEQREAQTKALALPDVGMVVAIDLGGQGIHPRSKRQLSQRLLYLALAQVYGQKKPHKAPSSAAIKVEGSSIRVSFRDPELGLKSHDGEPIKSFAIAGADRRFVWAKAHIDGETIVVSADEVKEPVAVRYAFQENPQTNLVSGDGLPVPPFRSDNW